MILGFEDFLNEGRIPKEYLSAPLKADKERMKSEIKKHSRKSDDDASAYKDWEADYEKGKNTSGGKRHKTKPSPATIAYQKKFKKNENFSEFNEFIEEKRKTKNSPEWKDSDAPDAEGKFRDLGIRALAKWLIKTRGGDLKKISGSLSQQVVFNRGEDPGYAEKMEKVRKEVYRQLGRKDLLDENIIFEKEAWETALKNKEDETGIPYRFLKKVYDKGLAAWKTGHRPGASQHQWAMARVNSWVTGKGGARNADKHVWDDYREWEKANESVNFPHEIKSEDYWRKIISTVPNISNRKKVTEILDTVMKKQKGFASERQMEVLRRAQKGDTSPYNTKN